MHACALTLVDQDRSEVRLCLMPQLMSLGMVIVSVLGNLWTPPVGREFTKASLGPNSGLSHTLTLP